MKQKRALLRACISCEWIFRVNKDTKDSHCPKCYSPHHGARSVYGDKAYKFLKTQEPWIKRKMAEYHSHLLKKVRDTSK